MELKKTYRALGAISGTSADGIDIAVIDSDGHDYIKIIHNGFSEYSHEDKKQILTAIKQKKYSAKTSIAITKAYEKAIKANILDELLNSIDIIGFHGQTIYHNPQLIQTVQIGNAFLLAKLMQKNIISNFREKDIVHGGQGAPLVPIYHHNLLKNKTEKNTAIVNIGGISNITIIGESEDDIIAGDTGPGCTIIDYIIRSRKANFKDINSNGIIQKDILKKILQDKFFKQPFPKSLTTQYFKKYLKIFDNLNTQDALATATAITANCIINTNKLYNISKWIISGGGRKNKLLIEIMKKITKEQIIIIDDIGINGDTMEAQAFGYLAIRCALNLPISYPKTTGAPKPLSGGIVYIP